MGIIVKILISKKINEQYLVVELIVKILEKLFLKKTCKRKLTEFVGWANC